jgi:integrase
MPKPKDLANKDGSVFEEPPGSGKWRAQIYIDGKIVRRRATSERNAHAKLRELIKLRDSGVEVGTGKIKLTAWLDEWYVILARAKRKPATIAGHRETCARYVIPYLGSHPIEAIKPKQLDEWLDILAGLELSDWTINGAFSRLRAALNVAVRRGLIARNPCDQVEAPPPPGDRRTAVLDTTQLLCLLDELASHRHYALFAVGGTLGLRPSELIGLRVGALSLDGDAPSLVVREQLQRIKGSDGKTTLHRERSTKGGREDKPNPRTIPLSAELVALLRTHLAAMREERVLRGVEPAEPGADELLFVSERGTPINDRNLLRTLHRACARAGVLRVSLHSLRHTAGSVMLAQGEQIVDVSAVLGHANANITASIYGHSFDAGKRSAVAAASAALLRKG